MGSCGRATFALARRETPRDGHVWHWLDCPEPTHHPLSDGACGLESRAGLFYVAEDGPVPQARAM